MPPFSSRRTRGARGPGEGGGSPGLGACGGLGASALFSWRLCVGEASEVACAGRAPSPGGAAAPLEFPFRGGLNRSGRGKETGGKRGE